MAVLIALHTRGCDALVWLLLRAAVAIDDHRRSFARRARHLAGSRRRLVDRWLRRRGRPTARPRGRRAWNRTAEPVEAAIVRLHVEQPQLGAGQLRRLAERVLAFRATRETIRRILIRRRDLIVELGEARRRVPRHIEIEGPRRLWGVDLTLVWILRFLPVWLLGVVDYHGSRVVALERLAWPTTAQIVHVLGRAIDEHGGSF
jgi:hypothetical protein